ncbi:MAG TPA: thioesterase family protein [Ktedonobacteraceae bacterium]|jgi:acyl-CoA thioester hydrolase|nr:thioesterase family protein [Ktedonobacteraceae bacterium]
MPETYYCWYPLQIRFRDLDPLAHVNNSVYVIYFEEARSHYFDQLAPWLDQWPSAHEHQQHTEEEVAKLSSGDSPNPRIQTGPRGQHYGVLVKEVTCTYELPLVRADQTEVGIRVVKVGRTSFVMEHQIRDCQDHARVFANGRSVMVWCNYHTGRPQPVPPSLRAAFEKMEQRDFSAPKML